MQNIQQEIHLNLSCKLLVIASILSFYTHLGFPLNFTFVFHCHVKGAYLCLAEVKWVKTGVPGLNDIHSTNGTEKIKGKSPSRMRHFTVLLVSSLNLLCKVEGTK